MTTPTTQEPMAPAVYLHKQGFTLSELSKLSQKDRDDLKRYAREEMVALGIPVRG